MHRIDTCEHHQYNQTFYVYGTGTLIHNKVILTSAQNIYCHRLLTEYLNIRFITSVNGNKCSGIYNAKRVHYPNEYTMQQDKNYNLCDDLSYHCGYVGWKTFSETSDHKQFIEFGYMRDSMQGSFKNKQYQHRLNCNNITCWQSEMKIKMSAMQYD